MGSITNSDESNRNVRDVTVNGGDSPNICDLCYDFVAQEDLVRFKCGHIYHTVCLVADDERRSTPQLMPLEPLMGLPATVLPDTGLTSNQSQFDRILTNPDESNEVLDYGGLEHLGWGLSPDVEWRLRRQMQLFLAANPVHVDQSAESYEETESSGGESGEEEVSAETTTKEAES